ncbi:16S rRNA (cytosine(1402)-N(4))-methyltransferase RsmH [Candidatus Peregrinibacteria bacterium]|nr:16S rRNA (cytosine(1402)-N(4))-methyltransferase RsmH [Candidatus Peregrinibacteria bacterium]
MADHIPVLTNQVLKFLDPQPGNVIVDCTLGAGGHSQMILEKLAGKGNLYGIEVDERNLLLAQEKLKTHKNVHFIRDNFENLETLGRRILQKEGRIDGILFDLGLSSMHVDEGTRGFSFQSEGPLDMRFDTRQTVTAADIINTYSLEDLLSIFRIYGEERNSYKIATRIVEHRKRKRFTTTSQLANFIADSIATRKGFYFKRHPATRIFQALRIATNREVSVVHAGLEGAIKVLSRGGKIVVISYHSLEDRIVKNIFKRCKQEEVLKILTKKPLEPDEKEMEENRRSRSAKLRAAKKIISK